MNLGNNNRKKRKIVMIVIVFLCVLLLATYGAYSYYVKNVGKENEKEELFRLFSNHDLSFFANNEVHNSMLEKMKKNSYQSDCKMTLLSTMQEDMLSKLDLSKFEFQYHINKNQQNKVSNSQLITKFADTPLLVLDFVQNDKQFALKSDEIVNRYVGVNTNRMKDTLTKLWNVDIDYVAIKKLKNFVSQREAIDYEKIMNSQEVGDYIELLKNNVSSGNISKKENVVVPLNSEQVTTTEYTIALSKSETREFLQEVSQKIEKDDSFLKDLVVANVQNFEEDSEILEYSDNDSVPENLKNAEQNLEDEVMTEVPAEENNFESSIPIWTDNTVVDNTTNTVQNTVVLPEIENTITSPTQNITIENTTIIENTTNTTPIVPVENLQVETPITVEPAVVPEDNQPAEPISEPELQNEPTSENVVLEDENLRPQGFIEVNENSDDNEEVEQDFVVGKDWGETLQNMFQLTDKIDWKTYLLTGAKANLSQEELTEAWQKFLENERKENRSMVVKAYIAEGKLVKISFQIPEVPKSFDIEIASKNNHEKYLNISVLNGQTSDSNGYTVSIYKKVADADIKMNINLNKISRSKIVQKTAVNFETKGTVNSSKYTTELDLDYSDNKGEFKVHANHDLNFNEVADVPELNEENCLFLDTLSDEDLNSIKEQIKNQMNSVLSEKNKNLHFMEVDENSLVIEQNEALQDSEPDDGNREEVKKLLVETIADKMRVYLDAGNELKLEDLNGLEIPDHSVEISINSNLAIIVVDGYRFTLDADFKLFDS